MDDHANRVAALSADGVLVTLAWAAGVPEDSILLEVDEVALELLDEESTFTVEIWTRFHYEDEDGQLGVAHHPGRLDALIPRAVRQHCSVEIGDELASS